mgnify:CR=1 FL=1
MKKTEDEKTGEKNEKIQDKMKNVCKKMNMSRGYEKIWQRDEEDREKNEKAGRKGKNQEKTMKKSEQIWKTMKKQEQK